MRTDFIRPVLLFAAVLVPPGTAVAGKTDAEAARNTVAGRYFGTLPSDACSSFDVLLTLGTDGRYVLQSYCQDDLASSTTTSTWAVTWNGTCVDLAPADEAQRRHEFALHDDNLLVLTTGSCIEPVEDPRGRTLRRADEPGER